MEMGIASVWQTIAEGVFEKYNLKDKMK